MRKYEYVPFKRLRRMYHRRWSWMRLAKIVVPVLLWLCSVWMMLTAIMAMMMGLI